MIEGLTVDVLVLARYAESRENMLNLLGGGIDRFDVPAFPAQIGFGVGISLRIPWAHIGSEHRIGLVIEDADGNVVKGGDLSVTQAPLERPAHAVEGQSFRLTTGFMTGCVVRAPGLYVLAARHAGTELARTTFAVAAA